MILTNTMIEFCITLVSIILILFVYKIFFKKSQEIPTDYKIVPVVKGAVPFFGHGLKFQKDIVGFIRQAYKENGGIFRIKIFLTDMIVVCDRNLIKEYFRAKEKDFSLYDVLERLFFADGFFDNPKDFPAAINIIKRTVKTTPDIFIPKIRDEAEKMILRMKNRVNNGKINLTTEMMRFVARTSARCFIGVDMSEEFMSHLMTFTDHLNKIVVLTYFLPKNILKKTLGTYWLDPYRKKMTSMLNDIINKYREDKSYDESMIIRTAVDYVDEKNGTQLTNEQIGNIIVCLLYVSSENTALGLLSSVVELSKSPKYWNIVRTKAIQYFKNNDIKGLINCPEIRACVMEAARLNTHIFALHRRPIKPNSFLGEYFVGNVDSIALCEPMLMCFDCAGDKFLNADQYNPGRFIPDTTKPKQRTEPMDSHSVMTWGSGEHLCPGKFFAIYEITVGMSLMPKEFRRFIVDSNEYDTKDYFSPSAFSERKVHVQLVPIEYHNIDDPITNTTFTVEILRDRTTTKPIGWIINNFLDVPTQEQLVEYTLDLSKNSIEHQEINKYPGKPFPITYYNLVYTGTSNCEKPIKWLELATKIWKLMQHSNLEFPTNDMEFDSVYAQLYSDDNKMNLHKDEHVDWGISVNIGNNTEFAFDGTMITLKSGDIIIADFSKVLHGVDSIEPNTSPLKGNILNRTRMSVQIRKNQKMSNLMSMDEFKSMIFSL